jgi:hypothetical protein
VFITANRGNAFAVLGWSASRARITPDPATRSKQFPTAINHDAIEKREQRWKNGNGKISSTRSKIFRLSHLVDFSHCTRDDIETYRTRTQRRISEIDSSDDAFDDNSLVVAESRSHSLHAAGGA